MSILRTDHVTVGVRARLAGGLYLTYILVTVLGDVVGHIGMGSPEQVWQTITTNPGMFRLGLVLAYTSALLFLLTAWALYFLLHHLDQTLPCCSSSSTRWESRSIAPACSRSSTPWH